MKIAVIGGGGVRSIFLAKSIAQKAEKLNITKLCFMDNDEIKLNIFGEMAKTIALLICPSLEFSLTTDSIEAVKDADYVITTIRVGGDSMRVRDERIALSEGVLGQETTGAAGFSFAMRSIPILINYCETIKKYAKPNVKVFNFTNPAGLVSQALSVKGYDFTFGICDAPSGMIRSFAELLNLPVDEINADIYGLNHLSFFNKISYKNEDLLKKLISMDEAYLKTDLRYFSKEMLNKHKFIPNEYLYYFFDRQKAVNNILNASKTRGELIEEVNKAMIHELLSVDVKSDYKKAISVFEKYYSIRENAYMAEETGIKRDYEWHFDPFSPDEGGYASVALKYIEIANNNTEGEMILCTKNRNAIDWLEYDDIVEITCDISADFIRPHKLKDENTDSYAKELIRRMKVYERNAAKAILTCDKHLAIESLALHPLVESYSIAEKLVNDYIELNSEYTGAWS